MAEWKGVDGYEGYKVSDEGKVVNSEGKELSPSRCRGYLQVNLWKDGKQRCMRIHRLVAEAFIPNPGNLREVNHIDGNKENNSAVNLEWCTREQNLKHEHSTGLGDKAKAGLRRSFLERRKPVIATSKKDGRRLEFESIQETGRQLGVHATKVCACLNGKRKSTGGYVFEYKEDN